MAAFAIKLHDIDEYEKPFAFRIDAPWLGSALAHTDLSLPSPFESGSIDVTAQKTGGEILVRGCLQQNVAATCSRCLGPVPIAIDVELATLFSRRAPVGADGEVEIGEDDFQREQFVGDQIELDGIVRELILLESPMQPLCSEDCSGISVPETVRGAPAPDGGKPIDPRLAPLLNFKKT